MAFRPLKFLKIYKGDLRFPYRLIEFIGPKMTSGHIMNNSLKVTPALLITEIIFSFFII